MDSQLREKGTERRHFPERAPSLQPSQPVCARRGMQLSGRAQDGIAAFFRNGDANLQPITHDGRSIRSWSQFRVLATHNAAPLFPMTRRRRPKGLFRVNCANLGTQGLSCCIGASPIGREDFCRTILPPAPTPRTYNCCDPAVMATGTCACVSYLAPFYDRSASIQPNPPNETGSRPRLADAPRRIR